ncbi:MAG: hypothetical protein U1E28_20875 [Beijerinckiaceae bacterium]
MDAVDDSKGFDLTSARWPLAAVLVWIVTRDEYCASHCADMSVDACDTWLEIKRTHFGLRAGASASDAWSGELVPALDDGKLRASATRAVVNRLGVEQVTTGLEFPPVDQRYAASGHYLAETDKRDRSVLRPNGGNFAHEWTEYRELSLARRDVLSLWPEWPSEVAERVPVVEDVLPPVALSPVQTYRWIIAAGGNAAPSSIDPEDFKKVMRAVELKCHSGALIATGALGQQASAPIDATIWERNGFYLYGEGIVTKRDLPGPALRVLADFHAGRSSRISDEGRRTRVWLDVMLSAKAVMKEFPAAPPEPTRAVKPTKLDQAAQWLQENFSQRPSVAKKVLVARIEKEAPHIGTISERHLTDALSIAFGKK